MKHFWTCVCLLVVVVCALRGSLVFAQGTAVAASRVEAGRPSFVFGDAGVPDIPGTPGTAGLKNGAAQRRAAARRFLAQRGLVAWDGPRVERARANLVYMRKARAEALRLRREPGRARASDAAAGLELTAEWVPLGPAQTVTPAYGPVTGRVTSVAVDTVADPTGGTVYLGTTGGGVWKSVNAAGPVGAVKFFPMTDLTPAVNGTGVGSLSVGAVSVGPSTGQPGGRGVVLAGTGDANDALDSYYGEGILRSADGGVTWTAIDEADKLGTSAGVPHSFDGEGFAGFAWSTVNAGLVVAAVTRALDGVVVNARQPNSVVGLYYSSDAGVSWQLATIQDGPGLVVQGPQTLPTAEIGGAYDGNAATAVAWNPVRQMFFAAVRFHGYYGSADGVTWTRLANQPGTGLSPTMCPTNPGSVGSAGCPVFSGALAVQRVTGDMFALSVDAGGLDQGIWQDVCAAANGSCTAGARVMFGTRLGDGQLENGLGGIAQGDYDLVLTAVASNADTVLYAGTEDIFKCSLSEGCVWRNTTNVTTCAAARVGPSQHAIAGAGPLLYFGNDSGLWRTLDGVGQLRASCSADDAAHFDNLNGGLGSLAEVTAMAADPAQAGTVMVAQGVNGSSATTAVANAGAWPQVLDGFGAHVAIDPAQALNWYASAGYGVAVYLCEGGGACDAEGFPVVPLVGDAQTAGDGEGLENPAVWMLDPQDATQMIVGTCRVWRGSVAGGAAAWTAGNALSGMLDGDDGPVCEGNAEVRSLGASGTVVIPGAGGAATSTEILYAGMDGTLDGGQTAAGHVYAASLAAGATGIETWTDIWASPVGNDLVNAGQFNPGGFAISAVVVDTHDTTGQTVYATVQGASGNAISEPTIYLSTSAGQSWTNITANLPAVPVNGVLVDPGDANVVYVATDVGVYVTTAVASCGTGQGACWNPLGTAMPDVPVTSLMAWGTGTEGVLRAGTYGRGVWQTGLVSAQEATGSALTTVGLTPGSLVFGTQALGTLSAAQAITVTNTGAAPLTIGSIEITGDFSEQDTCSAAVAPGANCVVMIAFFPTAAGARAGLLTMVGNVAGGQVTAALSGNGGAAGQAVLTPLILNFPPTGIGVTAPVEYITVSNLGTTAVSLQTPAVSGAFAIAGDTCAGSDAPASGCTVGVIFTPTIAGTASGTFSIVTGIGTLMAELRGTGLAPATDVLSPATLQFSAQLVGTASAAKTVTVSNTGGSVLSSVAAVSDSREFVVSAPGCVTGVPGGGACAVQVTFDPLSAGTRTGTLTITDALRTQTVGLSGTGVAAAGIPSVTESLQFVATAATGSVGYLASSLTSQTVVLTNNGKAALTGLGFAATGDFVATAGTCGDALGVGLSCNASVTFAPTQTGPRTGVLSVTGGGLGSGLTTALSGMGMEFMMSAPVPSTYTLVSGGSTSYAVSLLPVSTNASAWSGTVTLACTGAPAGYTCVPNPASFTLASGSTQSVTVEAGPAGASSAIPEWRGFAEMALGCVLPFGFRRRRLAGLAAFLLLVMAGCGTKATGGGTGGGGGGGTGSTPTTYTLVLTASAPGVQQSISMTLQVEQ